MGSYLFKWEHPASEVYVTGTFDDWGKTIKLDKTGSVHEKLVPLKVTNERILYKFVVDGNWTTDQTKKTETDSSGYSNNVLDPQDITASTISNTAGNTTVLGLAGQVPKEDSKTISNTATNQTTQAMAGQVPKEGAAAGVPGAFPETPGDSEVKVNPIPASAGAGNPIQLKAGEAVPKSTGNITGAVTTDQASYEKGGAPQLPSVVTPESERQGGFFGLGTKNIIPESSLPIVGGIGTNVTNSAGTGSTTAQLAGAQPIEPRGVPTVVKESQEQAHAAPEASANPEAVKEKSEVEKELEKKVPEEPAATESTMGGKAAATIGAAAAGVSAAAAGAMAYMSSGQAKDDAKATLPESTHGAIDKVAPDGAAQTASTVPDVVQDSIKDAHKGPEAAANKEAVAEKAEVESELLKKVKHEDGAGEPAPTAAAAVATEAPKATTTGTTAAATTTAAAATTTAAAATTTTTTTATEEKKKEDEAVRDSARGTETKSSASGGGAMAAALQGQSADSRDVSPMTRPDGTHATEHVGEKSGSKPLSKLKEKMAAAPSPTSSNNPKSPVSTASASSKDKRSSGFFRKLKEKFDHKEKK